MTLRRCNRCLTPASRPRVVFNTDGFCNACSWHERKQKEIDWRERQKELERICDRFRRKDNFDIIVPVSGGKDSSYVAWKLKHEFNMHPLCVTFTPPMPTELGRKSLENFRNSGFDLIELRPNPVVYRALCKQMFIDYARSKYPFVIGIGTAVGQLALKYEIPLIIWGEEGETEYGGENKYEDTFFLNYDYFSRIYHEGHNVIQSYSNRFTKQELQWWTLPTQEQFEKLKITWWSKYESWDDQLHRDLAIKKCNLIIGDEQSGTFTNYSQLDDQLQALHMYECFIKYGFGRATADANLAIKGGRMTREEGVKAVNELDGQFPIEYLEAYLGYFEMTPQEFWEVIDRFANRELLERTGRIERPWILKEPVK